MIIRLWTARATPKGAGQSQARFVRKILPRLRGLDGYLGASFLRRPDGKESEQNAGGPQQCGGPRHQRPRQGHAGHGLVRSVS